MTRPAQMGPNEKARLARLRQLAILDTRPEPIFDAITGLVAAIFGVPIALVSLVDADRQWFKSNFGLPEAAETPRDISFCSHAILGSDILIVEDAMLDDRFADNPLVTGDTAIRFYAGAPIVLSDGSVLGTVCAIDRVPRQITDQQRAILKQVSTVVAQAMEFRERAIRALETGSRDQVGLQNLFVGTPAMLHCIDVDGKLLTVSTAWLAELGYVYEEAVPRHIAEFFTPASRAAMIDEDLPALWRKGRCEDARYEMVRKDGSVFKVTISTVVDPGEFGAPSRGLAFVTRPRRHRRS